MPLTRKLPSEFTRLTDFQVFELVRIPEMAERRPKKIFSFLNGGRNKDSRAMGTLEQCFLLEALFCATLAEEMQLRVKK